MGHAPGRQRSAGTVGAKSADDRGADRRGEVGGSGVADDDRRGTTRARRRARAKRRPARQVGAAGRRDRGSHRLLPRPAGDDDRPAGAVERRREPARRLRGRSRGTGPRRSGAPRRSPSGSPLGHGDVDGPAAVRRRPGGRRRPAADTRSHSRLDLVTARLARVVGVAQATVAHVEQGAGAVVARAGDARHARPAGEQRDGQRALVEGGEDDHLVVPARRRSRSEQPVQGGRVRRRAPGRPAHGTSATTTSSTAGSSRAAASPALVTSRSRRDGAGGAASRRAGPQRRTSPSLSWRTASTRGPCTCSATAPPQDQVDGRAQVRARRPAARSTSAARVAAVGTSTLRAPGGPGRLDVGADVADDDALLGRARPGRPPRPRTSPAAGLRQRAAVVRGVRADLPRVEGAEELLDPRVHRGHLPGGEQPAADAGLVADDPEAQPGARRPGPARSDARAPGRRRPGRRCTGRRGRGCRRGRRARARTGAGHGRARPVPPRAAQPVDQPPRRDRRRWSHSMVSDLVGGARARGDPAPGEVGDGQAAPAAAEPSATARAARLRRLAGAHAERQALGDDGGDVPAPAARAPPRPAAASAGPCRRRIRASSALPRWTSHADHRAGRAHRVGDRSARPRRAAQPASRDPQREVGVLPERPREALVEAPTSSRAARR